MREKVAEVIRILGLGLNELVFDFEIDGVLFNSIEWTVDDDKILLHIFEHEMDYSCDFDGVDIDKQIKIYKLLSSFLNAV